MIAFKGKKFSVKVEKVKLPGGSTILFQSVTKQPGTAVIPLLGRDTIVMNLQYRPAVKKWIYELPGGKIEKGETPRANALKELQEELGLKAERIRLVARLHPAPYLTNDVQHLFLAQGLKQTKRRLEKGEIIKIRRVRIAQALRMCERGEITDATTIVGVYWLHRHLKVKG